MTSKAPTGLNLTPKQEKFCQLYIELGNASEAYRQSYDADSMAEPTVNREAKGLLDNPKIATRLDQIRKEHGKRHNVTVDTLLIELEEARLAAFEGERVQVAAAVAATMGKAKILGFDKQVIEHTGKDGKAIEHSHNVTLPENLAELDATELAKLYFNKS